MRVAAILVPVDFSAGSDAAIEWAQALSQAFGARLILLHVVDTSPGGLVGGPGAMLVPPAPRAISDTLRQEAETAMASLATRVRGAETLIVEGSPREQILKAAGEVEADLIVMGTHGRAGLAHLLLGSVAEHVVRHAAVPVVTIRRSGRS